MQNIIKYNIKKSSQFMIFSLDHMQHFIQHHLHFIYFNEVNMQVVHNLIAELKKFSLKHSYTMYVGTIDINLVIFNSMIFSCMQEQ